MKHIDDTLREAAQNWDNDPALPPPDAQLWSRVASARRKIRRRYQIGQAIFLSACVVLAGLGLWEASVSRNIRVETDITVALPNTERLANRPATSVGSGDVDGPIAEGKRGGPGQTGIGRAESGGSAQGAELRNLIHAEATWDEKTGVALRSVPPKPNTTVSAKMSALAQSDQEHADSLPASNLRPVSFVGESGERHGLSLEPAFDEPGALAVAGFWESPLLPVPALDGPLALLPRPCFVPAFAATPVPPVTTAEQAGAVPLRTCGWRHAVSVGPVSVSTKDAIAGFEPKNHSRIQLGANLRIAYSWSNGWYIETGADYAPLAFAHRRDIQFAHNPSGERFDPQRFGYRNNVVQRVATPYGETDLRIAYLREPGAMLQPGQVIGATLIIANRTQYLRAPLRVGMERGRGKWRYSLFGEIAHNRKLNEATSTQLFRDTRAGMREMQVGADRWSPLLKPVYTDWGFGGGITRMFGFRWGLSLEVNDRYSMGLVSERHTLRLRAAGIQLGLRYRPQGATKGAQ